ncbi:MAG: glycosyltransferase family 4 protein [Verrucomicrobiota bacterium]
MKILSLHGKFSSFFSVCFREAIERHGVDIRLVCSRPVADAKYDDAIYKESGVGDWQFREDLGEAGIRALIDSYKPDAILTSGWMFREYLRPCRDFRKVGGVVVAFSDTQFEGRFKQRLGFLLSPWVIQPSIDVILVAGERQRQYAYRLGYAADRVWEPMLCCDWSRFAAAKELNVERRKEFLYVGRLVESKGMLELRDAYQRYRSLVDDPWSLRLIGAGDQARIFTNEPGVTIEGFIQPIKLPQKMAGAGAYLLPSRFDPWGVALQEAAAVGLPLIASEAVGAAVHLIRDGWNGYVFETGNVRHFYERLVAMHNLKETERSEMRENSFLLSGQFKPERWAKTVVTGIERLRQSSRD